MRSISVVFGLAVLAVVLGGCGGDGGGGNNGVLNFILSGFTVNEDGSVVVAIEVSRTGGSGAISVTVVASDGTATFPGDYSPNNPIVLSWAAGDLTNKTVTVGTVGSGEDIEIVNDVNDEPDEFLNLALTTTTGGAVTGTQATATLTIVDNDVAGFAEFDAPGYGFSEDGMGGPINVNRVGGTDGDVSVTIVSTDGSANSDPNSLIEPVDYSAVSFTVSWVHGDATPQPVPISIVQDLLPEQTENLTLNLVNPTNGLQIGATPSATVSIFDDDTLLQIDNPFPVTNGLYGQSLARVGQRLAVGAPGNAAGQGRVYLTALDFGTVFDTIDGGGLSQQFGWSMSFGGSSTLGVGGQNGAWNFAGSLFLDSFSERYSVSNADLGFGFAVGVGLGRLFVGAPQAQLGGSLEPSGRVHAYDEFTGFASTPIDGAADNEFGTSFGWFDGDLLVGAPGNDGRVIRYDGLTLAHDFTLPNPFPQMPLPRFGHVVATSGSSIIVGAPEAFTFGSPDGRVHVFDGIAPPQTVLAPGVPDSDGRFGSQILVLSNGDIAVQQKGGGTSADPGRVILFNSSWTPIAQFDHPAPSTDANFGASMAELDGAIAIAAPNYPALGNTGSIFIFRLP
jgi:hypothetical protein